MNYQEKIKSSTHSSLNPFASEFTPVALIQLLLVPFLFIAVLYKAENAPEWFGSFHLDLLFLYFTPLLLISWSLRTNKKGLWIHVAQTSLLILITFILLRQHSLFIPVNGRTLHVLFVFLIFAIYPLVGYDVIDFLQSRAVYISAFVVILAVYFYHVNQMSAGSTRASFVVYIALFFGICLFYIPRYVSRTVFLWGISLVSGFVVLIGLPVYLIGSYDLFWFQPRLFGDTATLPLIGVQFHFLQSVLSNPNIVGVLAFAGTYAAFVLAGEEIRQRKFLLLPLAFPLFLLNGLGMYLTYARASWLALAIAMSIYICYLLLGRRSVPISVTLIGILSTGFIIGILLNLGIVEAHGRAPIWMGGLRAIKNAPSLLGYGVVNTHDVVESFITVDRYRGLSPHNSYIQIFLHIGIVGGLGYVVIVIGSLLEGIFRWKSVDVPMLGFAAAIAVHQTFAVYTLFNNAVASMLAILVFGYLICGYD